MSPAANTQQGVAWADALQAQRAATPQPTPQLLRHAGDAVAHALRRAPDARLLHGLRVRLLTLLALQAQTAWPGLDLVPAALPAAWALGEGGVAVQCSDAAVALPALGLGLAASALVHGHGHLLVRNEAAVAECMTALAPLWAACGMGLASLAAPQVASPAPATGVMGTPRQWVAALLPTQVHDAILAARRLPVWWAWDIGGLLLQDAAQAISLVREEDRTGLGAAVAAACALAGALQSPAHYAAAADGLAQFTAQGESLIDANSAGLPPVWRVSLRAQGLVRQALWVRDLLKRGVDFDIDPQGGLAFSPQFNTRWPQRDLHLALAQAVQHRHGLPPAPCTVTAARTHLGALLGPGMVWGGMGSQLLPHAAALHCEYGLRTMQPGAPPAPLWRRACQTLHRLIAPAWPTDAWAAQRRALRRREVQLSQQLSFTTPPRLGLHGGVVAACPQTPPLQRLS